MRPPDWMRPGAFCTDGTRLYEIVKIGAEQVTYENCKTFNRVTFRIAYAAGKLRCVKRAPVPPDNASTLAQAA